MQLLELRDGEALVTVLHALARHVAQVAVAAAATRCRGGATLCHGKVNKVLGALALGATLSPLRRSIDAMAFRVIGHRDNCRLAVPAVDRTHPEDLIDGRLILYCPHQVAGTAAAVLVTAMQHCGTWRIDLRCFAHHANHSSLRQLAERLVLHAHDVQARQVVCKQHEMY